MYINFGPFGCKGRNRATTIMGDAGVGTPHGVLRGFRVPSPILGQSQHTVPASVPTREWRVGANDK